MYNMENNTMDKVDVNDVIVKYVGSFGRYQKVICFQLGMIGFFLAFYAYDIVFAAAIPEHWCTPPDLNGTKFFDLNQNSHKILTIPRHWENGKLVFSSCELFVVNYSNPKLDYHDIANASRHTIPIKHCDKWTYDHSTFETTAVIEWDLVCDRETLVATSQSVMMVGRFIGSFICGFLSDRFGRRPVLLAVMIGMIPARLLISLATNYYMFMIGYMFGGGLSISQYTVSFVLVVELVGSDWREFVGVLGCILWGFGLMALAAIGYAVRERMTLQLVLSIPTLLVLLYFLFMPESPRWLLARKRKEEAVKILRKMARINGREIPYEILENLEEQDQDQKGNETIVDLIRCPVLLFRLLVSLVGWFNVNLAYVGLMLNMGNLFGNIYANMALGGLLESVGYLIATYLMGRKWLGRRPVLSGSFILCGACLLLTLAVPPDKEIYVTVLAQLGKLFISVAYAVIYVYIAELYPSSVRNSGLSACITFGKIANIISPYLVHLGVRNPMIPLIICGVLGLTAGMTTLILPETRGQKLIQTVADQKRTDTRLFWCSKNEVQNEEKDKTVVSDLLSDCRGLPEKNSWNQTYA